MTFISYAQNLEDVMLWRALKHIKNGFYIDVGANDPEIDSVTKAFYDQGWSGINIEPLASHHQDLLKNRKRDTNLLCAAGKTNGQIEIWECDVRGWATASKQEALRHESNGHKGKSYTVPMMSLGEICCKYVKNEIHFFKIDVEGFEKEVIAGMDFLKFRPWILMIEATKPNSTEEVHGEWEPVIQNAHYSFAYADGLNRFYVANEHAELLTAFKYPPNVFDEYKLNALQQAEAKLKQAEAKLQQAEAVSLSYLAQLNGVLNSKSWRITKPLREANVIVNKFRALRVTAFMKLTLKNIIKKTMYWLLKNPKFRQALINLSHRLGLYQYLKSLHQYYRKRFVNYPSVLANHHPWLSKSQQDLSPRARQIYVDLKAAIEQTKKEQQTKKGQ